MQDLSYKIDEYNFYKSKGVDEGKLKEYFNISEDNVRGDPIIYIERLNKKKILSFKSERSILFSVEYHLPN